MFLAWVVVKVKKISRTIVMDLPQASVIEQMDP